VVLAVTAVGSWLALHDLAGPSPWSDEVSRVAIAGGVGPALWHGIASDGGNMALYYLLLRVEINLVADGHEARSYALVTLLVVAAWWAFLRLAERPSWRRTVPWVLLSVAAIACHLLATLFVAAMVAALVVAGRRLVPARMLVVGGLAIAGLCSPLALLAAHRGTGQISSVAPVRLHTILATFAWLGSAHAGPLVLAVTTAAWIVGAGLCLVGASRSRAPADRLHALAPLWWVVVPVARAVGASLLIHPVLVSR
jgi:hypothetical protein